MRVTLKVNREPFDSRWADRFTHLRYRTTHGQVHFMELWMFGRQFLWTILRGNVDERDELTA